MVWSPVAPRRIGAKRPKISIGGDRVVKQRPLVAELMARIPANEDGDRVRGLFLASHEIDGTTEWQVREGQLFISPGDGRHRNLDG
ncbi:hypothetical protein [Streptomyces canus]|uniref:hypothetical protein n=1 Tax=Streptomyces canus TaxID=58343 RepID=UPI00380E3324